MRKKEKPMLSKLSQIGGQTQRRQRVPWKGEERNIRDSVKKFNAPLKRRNERPPSKQTNKPDL